MTEIDLEIGDPSVADPSPAARRRRTARTKEDGTKKATQAPERSDEETSGKLNGVFGRIAEALRARGDEELATAIEEDSAAMGQGLVSLTRNFRPLRTPLLLALSVAEPVLAFGRVGRILADRFRQRRREAQLRNDVTDATRNEEGS
jgi:hypothetical protein